MVRVAGNVAGKIEQESLRFAVDILQVPLVIVLGHSHCGAVHACIEGQTQHFPSIAALLSPALAGRVLSLDAAIKTHVRYVTKQLAQTPFIRSTSIAIIGAIYQLDTGKVEIFESSFPQER